MDLDTQCADTIGNLPEFDEPVSWLPVDYAAKNIVELVNLPTSPADCPVYHVLHPTHVTWSSILFRKALEGFRPYSPLLCPYIPYVVSLSKSICLLV